MSFNNLVLNFGNRNTSIIFPAFCLQEEVKNRAVPVTGLGGP
jgi:hypothetical protein